MALSKFTKDTAVIENVGTKPEDRTDLNDTTFKRKWDENATDWKTFWNDTATPEIDALITAIKGAGWTSESLKGLADLLSTHAGKVVTSESVHGLQIESGTFTPVLAGTTTPGSNTYTAQVGEYYKVGKLVYFFIRIQLSTKDGAMAGNIAIQGLPFANGANQYQVAVPIYGAFTSAPLVSAYLGGGLNYFQLVVSSSGTSFGYIPMSAIANNTELRINGVYKIA